MFTQLCERYLVGEAGKAKGDRVVLLTDDFIAYLNEQPRQDDALTDTEETHAVQARASVKVSLAAATDCARRSWP